MVAIVVEDNDLNFILVRQIMKPLGWTAHQISRADHVRGSVAEHSPDLIIMDISLPDGDGLELTSELRGEGIETPIVVMSAHAYSEMGVKAFDAGANAFFAKPFSLNELERILQKITNDLPGTLPPPPRVSIR